MHIYSLVCVLGRHESIVLPYVGMARNKMAATMQVYSVQTPIVHLVVNSTHPKTVRSALWRCPNTTVVLRLLVKVVRVTNLT